MVATGPVDQCCHGAGGRYATSYNQITTNSLRHVAWDVASDIGLWLADITSRGYREVRRTSPVHRGHATKQVDGGAWEIILAAPFL